jgi:hypothetical protein
MLPRARINRILYDDRLTRSLGDEEARALIDWLADAADQIPPEPEDEALAGVEALYLRGRVLARLCRLLCHERQPGAAAQLAACEGLALALPPEEADPYQVMRMLVIHEASRRAA